MDKPNDLHVWIIYKEKWICEECGCCEYEECCGDRINKECVSKDNT